MFIYKFTVQFVERYGNLGTSERGGRTGRFSPAHCAPINTRNAAPIYVTDKTAIGAPTPFTMSRDLEKNCKLQKLTAIRTGCHYLPSQLSLVKGPVMMRLDVPLSCRSIVRMLLSPSGVVLRMGHQDVSS